MDTTPQISDLWSFSFMDMQFFIKVNKFNKEYTK